MKISHALLAALAAFSSPALAQAAKPWTFSFGGQLLDGGKPVGGGAAIELKFYKDATGGTPLPVTPVTFTNVPLQDGVFQVDATMLGAAELDLIFGGDKPTWVEVIANGKVYFRQMVVAVPYALRVPVDEKRVAFDQTSGKLTVGPKTNAQSGEFLTQTSSGDWAWQTPAVVAAPAASIAGRAIDPAAPTAAGQVLRYDGAAWKAESLLPPAENGKFLTATAAGLAWGTPTGAGDMATGTWDEDRNGSIDIAKGGTNSNPAAARTSLGLGTLATLSSVGASELTSNAVTSETISNGSILDADISATAAISRSKLGTTGDLALSESAGTAAKLKFQEPGGTDWVTLRAASGSASYDLQLPPNAGVSGDVLKRDGSDGLSWYSLANHTAAGTTGQIQLKGAAGFDADSNLVYASAKLGVGINTPPFHLTVSQPTGSTPGFNNDKSAFGIVHAGDTNQRLYMGVEDDGDAYLQADKMNGGGWQPILLNPYGGKVGIGTVNDVPSAHLTVQGGAMPDNSVTAKIEKLADWKLANSENALEKGTEAQLWLGRWEDSGTNARSSMTFSLLHDGSTGTTDVMTMESSGRVGIGTSSPFDRLTVSGGSVLLENGSPSAGDGKFRTQTFSGSVAPEFRTHRALALNAEVTAGVVLGDFAASGRQDGGSENVGGSIQVVTTEDWSTGSGRGSKVVVRAIKDGASTLTNALAVYGSHVAFGGGQAHKLRVDATASVTAAADDHVLILTATVAATVTLPSCGSGAGGGRVLVVRNNSGSSGTLSVTDSSALPGTSTLTAGVTRTLICDPASTGTWFDL